MEATNWFGKAAEQGHAKAQALFGFMYFRANGVSTDYDKAAKWFRKAAEQGEKQEQYLLGPVTVWFRILDSNISNQGDRLWDNDMAWNSNGKRFALL